MDALTTRLERGQKIVEQRRRLRLALDGIAKAHPAALALLRRVVGVNRLPVVGRVANTDQHRRIALDLLGALLLFAKLLVGQGQIILGLGVRRFQRISQIDMHPVGRQRTALGDNLLGQAQVSHRIRADQQLEGVHILGSGRRRRSAFALTLHRRNLIQAVLHGGQDVGTSAGSRVKGDHILINEGELLIETIRQQLGHQPHLTAHHLQRRIVDAAIIAHLRVVGS